MAVTVRLLSQLRLRIRAIEVARDPDTKRWIRDMKTRLHAGELDAMVRAQPDDPRSILGWPSAPTA